MLSEFLIIDSLSHIFVKHDNSAFLYRDRRLYHFDWFIIFFTLQAAAINYAGGSLVWVEDHKEAWLDGEVLELNGEELKVKCTTGNTVSSIFFDC